MLPVNATLNRRMEVLDASITQMMEDSLTQRRLKKKLGRPATQQDFILSKNTTLDLLAIDDSLNFPELILFVSVKKAFKKPIEFDALHCKVHVVSRNYDSSEVSTILDGKYKVPASDLVAYNAMLEHHYSKPD